MIKQITAAALLLTTVFAFTDEIVTDSKGRKILLREDFTWEFQKTETPKLETQKTEAVLRLTKSPKLDRVLKTRTKKVTIHFNSNEWRQTSEMNASAEFSFQNTDNTGFGMLIYDGLPIPLSTMEEMVIKNANNIDPNAYIKSIEACEVNGTSGELITYLAKSSGLEFTFYSFVATKDAGTIQYTFYTLSSYFEKLKPSFTEAISGIEF